MKNIIHFRDLQFRDLFITLFILGCIFTAGTAFAQDWRIFILHSYHQEYPWTSNENNGFTQTLNSDFSDSNFIFSTEYLDTKRVVFSKEYQAFFFNYLKQKYIHYLPDVIFCSDDDALEFLLNFKVRLFGDTPVVFCGVNNLSVVEVLNREQYAGIFEKKEIAPNLSLLKTLNPRPGNIIILGDNSSTHQAIEQQIKNDIVIKFPKQKYTILANDQLSYLITRLKTYKEGVIFLTTIGGLKDKNAGTLPLQKSIASIVKSGNFTIISMEDVYLEEGVFGGYVTSGSSQGKEAANFAIQILKGESPSSIALVKDSPNEYMFNYPQLIKLGIPISQLPPKSIILNKPQSFYDHYRYRIWIAVISLTFQTLIIFILIKNIYKRKCAEVSLKKSRDELEIRVEERTVELTETNASLGKEIIERKQIEEELKKSEGRFKALHDASYSGIVIHDKGIILDCNQGLSDITGFTNEELVGMNGLNLIAPDWLDPVLNNIERGYDKDYEVEGVRKDGSVYPLSIRGKNVSYKGRNVRVIEFRDITELRQAKEEIKKLQGILPICCVCGLIRDDTGVEQGKGEWLKIDKFVTQKTDAQVSHSYCPKCHKKAVEDF